MISPGFWWNPPDRPGWQARLLSPLSLAWRLGAAWRGRGVVPWRAPVPVLCVGNLTAGGAGKTPMVAALLARLLAAGRRPHVVSRGHGGRLAGPHRVDPAGDTHAAVGDEALLLAALAPVWVARDRAAGVRAAAEAGAELVLMDDGFQNPSVAKDAAILMVDAGQVFGNGRMIPAGPLREPVSEGLARADLTVLVGGRAERDAAIALWPALADAVPARLVPRETGLVLAGEKVLAFAGIGWPEKFFATLREMGAHLTGAVPFADHCRYAPAVLRRLQRSARSEGAMLVTTEKDAARLPASFIREVVVVQVVLEPEDWSPIDRTLALIEQNLPHSTPG